MDTMPQEVWAAFVAVSAGGFVILLGYIISKRRKPAWVGGSMPATKQSLGSRDAWRRTCNLMCNLYSITRTQEVMRRLFRVDRDFLGNFHRPARRLSRHNGTRGPHRAGR
jgi:hypothetical protein